MNSLVTLKRGVAHRATRRLRIDFSLPCKGACTTTKFTVGQRFITQCNVNVKTNVIRNPSYASSNNTIRSYCCTTTRLHRRFSNCSWSRQPGRGSEVVNHESCLGVKHFFSHKIQFFQQLKRFSSTDSGKDQPNQALILVGTIDRFNGVRIDMDEQLRRNEVAKGNLNLKGSLFKTLSYYKAENKPAVWLKISAQCGHVIPLAAEVGFCFHHAENNHVMMYQWLGEGENRIPEYATHQVGVSGFVLDQQRQQVLMVQDRHRIARWKFPGGYSKLGEDFSETAKREVFEETGIKTEFKSILAFRQQHQMPYSFNRSDIYVVCRLEPLTFDLNVCSTELLDAKWIPLKELFASEVHTGLTLHVAGLAKRGLKEGFQNVDIAMSELPSVYKGVTYKLFSRPSF